MAGAAQTLQLVGRTLDANGMQKLILLVGGVARCYAPTNNKMQLFEFRRHPKHWRPWQGRFADRWVFAAIEQVAFSTWDPWPCLGSYRRQCHDCGELHFPCL